ncbi:hypothetical protein ABL78_8432, partial [Leptomonas seymouri]
MNPGDLSLRDSAAPGDLQNGSTDGIQQVALFIHSSLAGLMMALQYWLPFPPECLLLFAPFIFGILRTLWPSVNKWIQLQRSGVGRRYATRTIMMEAPPNRYNTPSNFSDMLLNAVLMYLNERPWRAMPLTDNELRGLQMRVLLMDPYRCYHSRLYNSPFKPGYDETDADEEQKLRPTTVERLRVVRVPMDMFVTTREDDIEVRYEEEQLSVAGHREPWTRHKLTLRCSKSKGAAAKLDALVTRALEMFA